VIDFPVTHLGRGNTGSAYQRGNLRFVEAWSGRCWFRYVGTTVETVFMSRSKILQRLFGSSAAVACVEQCRLVQYGLPLRRIDPSPGAG
jgi:hypothetical protein